MLSALHGSTFVKKHLSFDKYRRICERVNRVDETITFWIRMIYLEFERTKHDESRDAVHVNDE